MNQVIIDVPDTDTLTVVGLDDEALAICARITNKAEHEAALLFVKRCKDRRKHIVELFERPKRHAHATHAAICQTEAEVVEPYTAAIKLVNPAITVYEEAEERRVRDEQLRLEAVAREAEQEAAATEAVELADQGRHQEAEAVLEDAADVVPTVEVVPELAKVKGLSSRKTWSAEVFDLKALIQFVAANPQWTRLLKADQTVLNKQATAMKQDMRFDGVRAKSKTNR